MSTDTHVDHDDIVEAHGTRKGYLIGFALSVVLTAIPFALVMTGTLPQQVTAYAIMIFAAVQIVVHMIYFLHMTGKSEGGWTIMALIFTVVMIGIAFSGTLWVMYHLSTNMMPMSPSDMRQIP
ncbi:cytochrome o ubiquinol oxidase subunit IV [Sphingobium sp. CECT 9361]|uniref:cytochrome o ubiquinol oxidase subunit IV n=1 Tax=Sphingobium sp. CECT 9361 TaxID=2845384 RepID=UPI001E2B74B8|nr:cytochrome o ubiquinol oxidase subunit IV [Sphingobium sp. CECT 9361]CAH0348802.1 Cytochrome bo(3) ubiquinol oxidase subunit 4 [Sphingobium sp. CECT 9361]